jgi:hypothetical protein
LPHYRSIGRLVSRGNASISGSLKVILTKLAAINWGVGAYLASGGASYHRSYQGAFLEPVAFRVQLDTRLIPWVLKYAVASFSVSGNKNLLGCPKIIEERINEPW